jgi:hypothetical protein
VKKINAFTDLQSEGIVQNWRTLNSWIDNLGFPPGRFMGRRRVWTDDEILKWLHKQPSEKAPAKGRAKQLKDGDSSAFKDMAKARAAARAAR